jgi:hypothetical protein
MHRNLETICNTNRWQEQVFENTKNVETLNNIQDILPKLLRAASTIKNNHVAWVCAADARRRAKHGWKRPAFSSTTASTIADVPQPKRRSNLTKD